MKDRIVQIMEAEQLSPSAFADKLGIGRAVISHILNNRNKPSLDIIMQILSKMDYINSDWLLSGKGNMYKENYHSGNTAQNIQQPIPYTLNHEPEFPNLFAENEIIEYKRSENQIQPKENIVKQAQNIDQQIENKEVIYKNLPERKISKIIIYYTDNTFETFNADNKPL